MSRIYTNLDCSFAGTGCVATTLAWFLLPEVALRTPAEIDEMYVLPLFSDTNNIKAFLLTSFAGLRRRLVCVNSKTL